MRKPLLSVVRQNTKLLNSIIFFTCWSQLHAHANSLFLNKGENVTPIMEVSSSSGRNIESKSPEQGKNTPEISDSKGKTENKNNIQTNTAAPTVITLPETNPRAYGKTRYYLSDIKEGIIGTDADHPIDQVYDNIFTISLDEKINPEYQYTLEYDLYGATSYKEVSKVINDELATGGNNLLKNKGWIHQSEPVSVSSVHYGINTIIFTIPHLSKSSYKVRNLQIGVSEKKQNLGSVGEKYNAATISKFITNIGGAEKLNLGSAGLAIPQGALKSSENFSITALRDIDMPALSPEMVNVTSHNAGYRFLPHGEHFSAPAKVTIGYDKSKIPTGYTEQDIRTYYFDKQQKKWIALEKDTLNHQQSALISKTTHFTDMVNGILKVPESPETGSYAPNSIKDIKAANPSEGIVSIAPPTPNSMGSVTTNFPIKLPAGRTGMQPSLNVSYSSEGGNGWMGMGWDMSVPAVSIDTRWGVPTYGDMDGDSVDDGKETEIYTLGGEQLTFEVSQGVFAMPNRNEGFNKDRVPDRQFYPRVEGAYSRIIRKGINPDNYVWVVTSKDGTASYFGGDETGVKENAVLRDANGNIGHWGLYKTIDANGNYVKYEYDKPIYSSSGAIGNGGKEMYVKKIEYALHDANPSLKKYTVNFGYDAQQREDVQVNARLGFVQVTSKRLGNIQILYDGTKVRSYDFQYKKGAFSKSLLESITEKDANDNVFYTNKIEYFNNIETSQYTPETTINAVANDAGIKSSSLLGNGNSKNTTVGGALTFGIALAGDSKGYNPLIKSATLGGDYQYTDGDGGGRISMTDVDGDGLPDKIVKNDWSSPETAFQYRKKGRDTNPFGGNLLTPENSKSFSYSKSYTNAFGVQATAGDLVAASGSFGTSKTKDFTYNYFTDANSDGIQDIVSNGQIYFGRIDNGVLKYTTDVSLTPNPITKGAAISTPSIDCNDLLEDYKNSPLHDVVKVWKAPYDGYIKISGLIKLKNPASPDGVKISLQYYKPQTNTSTFLIPFTVLNAANSTYMVNQPSVEVKQGDYFYFRINSIDNGTEDAVELPINIEYIYAPLANIYHLYNDSSETPLRQFNNISLVSSKNGTGVPVGVSSGTITGTFIKPITVRDININVLRKQTNGTVTLIANQSFAYNSAGNNSISFSTGSLSEGDILYYQVKSDVNEKWENLSFNNLKLTINYNGDNIEIPIIPDFQFFNLKTNTPSTFKSHFSPPANLSNYGLYAKLAGKPEGKYTFIVRTRPVGTGNFAIPQITTINWTGSASSIQQLSIYQSIQQGYEYYVECYSDLASDEGLDSYTSNIQVELREPVYFNTSAPNVFATHDINVYGKDTDKIYQTGSTSNLSQDD